MEETFFLLCIFTLIFFNICLWKYQVPTFSSYHYYLSALFYLLEYLYLKARYLFSPTTLLCQFFCRKSVSHHCVEFSDYHFCIPSLPIRLFSQQFFSIILNQKPSISLLTFWVQCKRMPNGLQPCLKLAVYILLFFLVYLKILLFLLIELPCLYNISTLIVNFVNNYVLSHKAFIFLIIIINNVNSFIPTQLETCYFRKHFL